VAPVKVLQELVRHKDQALTIGQYAHAGESAKAEAMERMNLPLAPPLAPSGCRP
jgi:erythromycin esterase-like protein